jgi:hypothetical protein
MSTYSDPAFGAVVITPADGTDIANPGNVRALYIGGGGNLNVDMADGTTVLFSNVPAGSIIPIRVKRVRNTSTTATLILALY